MLPRSPSPARRRGGGTSSTAASRALSTAFELAGGRPPSPPPGGGASTLAAAAGAAARVLCFPFPAAAWARRHAPWLAGGVFITLVGAGLGGLVGGVAAAGACLAALALSGRIFFGGAPATSPPASPPHSPLPLSLGARCAVTLEAGIGARTATPPGVKEHAGVASAPAGAAVAAAKPPPPPHHLPLPGGQTRLDRFVYVAWGAPRSPEIRPA